VPEEWMDYWVAHPVYKNWYTGGQITKSHLPVMDEVGFKSVVNLRSGIMLDGKPNQEEVHMGILFKVASILFEDGLDLCYSLSGNNTFEI